MCGYILVCPLFIHFTIVNKQRVIAASTIKTDYLLKTIMVTILHLIFLSSFYDLIFEWNLPEKNNVKSPK